MRIYIFTDTHLGYQERDETLGDDSFAAFEEGLLYARALRADFAVHGGDLFDIQKPTQSTIHKAMTALSRYCFDDDYSSAAKSGGGSSSPSGGKKSHHCGLEVSSRHKEGALYNFERRHIRRVHLPIFMIYGNHDPPITHHDGQVVSPLDIIEAACLINDIGKHDQVDKVVIKPVILRSKKGSEGVKPVALYGIGYIRDERMNRLFESKKIVFVPPPGECEFDSEGRLVQTNCFCILLIHQNRFKGSHLTSGVPTKRCVNEELLPSFMNLIIWGHEHDCDIELRRKIEGGDSCEAFEDDCMISQPGSSVYTSLKKGEATFKRNAIIEITPNGSQFYTFPLMTPRPFIFRQVNVLDEQLDLKDHLFKECTTALEEDARTFLVDREIDWFNCFKRINNDLFKGSLQLNDLLQEVMAIRVAGGGNGQGAASSVVGELDAKNKKPLIRLRVEVPSAFDLSNFSITRFGVRFQTTVANYEDIVLVSKAGSKKRKSSSRFGEAMNDDDGADGEEGDDSMEDAAEDAVEETEDPELIIFENILKIANLQLLDGNEMNSCVKKYVDKTDLNVFEEIISSSKSKTMKVLKDLKSQDMELLSQKIQEVKSCSVDSGLFDDSRIEAVGNMPITQIFEF